MALIRTYQEMVFTRHDMMRIVHNQHTAGMNIINDNYREHRYEQRGNEYTLRSWRDKEYSVTASMTARPEWLVRIIDLAIVSGNLQKIPVPPPDVIVWFRTGRDDNDLIEFITLGGSNA